MRFSIVIPTIDSAPQIPEQTVQDHEIIVIKDDERIGPAWARNQGINKAKGETDIDISVEDLDSFEPIQFENWWADKIKEYGMTVKETPKSWDKGADVVATHLEKNKNYIFQCKHHNNPKTVCNVEAVKDCLEAQEEYLIDSPYLVAITNSGKFDDEAIQLASQNNVNLITRNEIMNWRPY